MRLNGVLRKQSVAGLAIAFVLQPSLARPTLAQDQSEAKVPASAVKVEPEVMEQHCIKKVSPIYPQMARLSRVQGAVALRVWISKTGAVTPLAVISGVSMLQDAAKSTVRKWEYKPYVANGGPADVTTQVSVVFRLDAPEGEVTHPNQ
jgi:TonB family protein